MFKLKDKLHRLNCFLWGYEYNWYNMMFDEFHMAVQKITRIFNLPDSIVDKLYNIKLTISHTDTWWGESVSPGSYKWNDYNSSCPEITINMAGYRMRELNPYNIQDTIRHEIAHHFVNILYTGVVIDHGPLWQSMCMLVDAKPAHSIENEDIQFSYNMLCLNPDKFENYKI